MTREEETTDRRTTCTVTDGRFVEPCHMLMRCTDNLGSSGRAKGLVRWEYHRFNHETKDREPSRTFYGARCNDYPKGVVFNHCPFCGTRIDLPVLDAEDRAALATAPQEG